MKKVITYVDLESILDLRQGFLVTKGKSFEEVKDYLSSHAYNTRDTDDLMEFSGEEYRQEVESGNIDLVKNAIVTNVFSTIIGKLLNVGIKTMVEGVKYAPEVWVNVRPFKFTQEESDLLRDCIFTMLGGECFVELVTLEPKTLSPAFIKETGIESCYIYNFAEWADLHMESIPKVNVLEVDFVFPPIYKNEPKEEDLEIIKEQGFEDGFSYLQFFFAVFARITFLPITYYTNYLISKDIIAEYEKIWEEEQKEKVKEYESDVEEYLNEHFSGKY